MAEKQSERAAERPHTLNYANNVLTIGGVVSVAEISEKEAQLKLSRSVLTIKGSGLNVVKLDREQGTITLEAQTVAQIVYRAAALGGIKNLFR